MSMRAPYDSFLTTRELGGMGISDALTAGAMGKAPLRTDLLGGAKCVHVLNLLLATKIAATFACNCNILASSKNKYNEQSTSHQVRPDRFLADLKTTLLQRAKNRV